MATNTGTGRTFGEWLGEVFGTGGNPMEGLPTTRSGDRITYYPSRQDVAPPVTYDPNSGRYSDGQLLQPMSHPSAYGVPTAEEEALDSNPVISPELLLALTGAGIAGTAKAVSKAPGFVANLIQRLGQRGGKEFSSKVLPRIVDNAGARTWQDIAGYAEPGAMNQLKVLGNTADDMGSKLYWELYNKYSH